METRKAHHSYETKENLISRLKKIEGQVRGVAGMIEKDLYCDDILNQFSSIQAALSSVRKQLLEAHIKSCVVEQIRKGKPQIVDELMVTIGKMVK
jgi:CsoR family transcriptional regulator, copper-sensing transcriptional repressor